MRGRRQFERALDHFARIDRRVIDGAGLLHFVGDELVALVEEQDAELLLVGEGLRRAAVVEHADQDDSTGRFCTWSRAEALAAACTTLRSVDDGVADTLTSCSRARGAATTSAKEPKRAISSLASGLTSRRGMARNSISSSSS